MFIFHVQHCHCFYVIFSLVSDPRTAKWPLMSSPFPTLVICLSYIYFVKVLGPRLMENRKPMELRKVLIYYNLLQVSFSIWLFLEVSFSNVFHWPVSSGRAWLTVIPCSPARPLHYKLLTGGLRDILLTMPAQSSRVDEWRLLLSPVFRLIAFFLTAC